MVRKFNDCGLVQADFRLYGDSYHMVTDIDSVKPLVIMMKLPG